MEPDIKEAIEYGLQPPQAHRTTAGCSRPLQTLTRRRAVTIGSISTPAERLGGLQIRFPTNRSPLSRHSAISANPLNEALPAERANVNDENGVVESDRDRMDIDTANSNEVEDEGSLEDPMTDAEALRSPPPEEDVSYSTSFSAGDTQDPSSQLLPTTSPATIVTAMDVDESSLQTDAPVSDRDSPLRTGDANPMIPSSPRQGLIHVPVPPNAPLLPYAVPPHASHHSIEGSHQPRLPLTSHRRISALHADNPTHDWRIPRSEDIVECLETLAYLSKYPKLRAFFNSTRFTPSILHHWATPDDETKEVNVFEIVERFTFTKHHPDTVCFWASIVMRHYSRKDEVVTKRQCGNLQCRQWETDEPGLKFICCPKCKYYPSAIHNTNN